MSLERNVERLEQVADVDEIRQIVQENHSERDALVQLLKSMSLKPNFVGGDVGGSNEVQLLSGRQGDADRVLVSIERNQRRDGRPVAIKIAEKAAELRDANVVVSHRMLKRLGFGTDSVRDYLNANR